MKFQLEVRELDFDDVLDSLAQRIVGPYAWRLSIYSLDGDEWRRIARRSTDPLYESGGRESFSRNGGLLMRLLSRALRNTEPAIEVTGTFPDAALDLDAWLNAQVEWNALMDEAQQFRMKSRRYAAAAIRLDGSRGKVFAIVLEVQDPEALSAAVFERHITRDVLTLLSKLYDAQMAVSQAHRIVSGV